ncbi:SUMF1/EgtB/PvdO family nonheme iron enzyme [Accumulibacter sp.]|uniref:nSTAND1 domain-containing NTPase n=1 Tax=Accumulibacter sp. TaxID=2053492 RepID=UPI0025E7BB37|nr:SUMF1/EgtB/PvdO family nonheme iron enzyme [Accumulibacter sp.]MCM8664678.1 SUMF1/EgtB/PvdO family nonheme iron enzyme [Accumulibacter sp.]
MSASETRFDLFLSYNRLDLGVVEPFARALAERGVKVFKDDWYLRPGEFWPTALERNLAASRAVLVAVGRHGLGPWQQREAVAALDRQNQAIRDGLSFPVVPLLLDQGSASQAGLVFLLQNTWVTLSDPRALDLIEGAVHGKATAEIDAEIGPDPRQGICPYRGLRFFREEDAGFFFGRDADAKTLLAALEGHRMVGVVGASGSGKSSLVRAGLIPKLRRGASGHTWQIAVMMPGSRPYFALARVLLPLREPERITTWSKGEIDDETERLARRLERDGAEHLHHVVQQIFEEEPGTTHLLLLVDQWEELYTHRPREGEAAAAYAKQVRTFIGMLLAAVTIRDAVLKVVLTLRADYWGEVLNDPSLSARLTDEAIVHLRALARPALEQTIRGPAQAIGLGVPDALAETLLDDGFGQAGDLALLEYALQELWKERDARAHTLTLCAYQAMGRLPKAIVSRAEAVYRALDKDERDAVPGVFAALVQVGEARSDLRRRARLAELGDAARRVVGRLADERLLVTGRDGASGEQWVEVAHEALLRHWPKLEQWINERRDALVMVRQLQADARTWLEKGQHRGYLWSHERAREAAAALAGLTGEVVLSRHEQDFLGPIATGAIMAEVERSGTPHARRLFLGERLAILGDPRPGVGVSQDGVPKLAGSMVEVPGGSVAIDVRSDPNHPDSAVIDRRSFTVGRFWIARYPVTVAQYRAFLDAPDGWRDARWWEPDLYRDGEGNSYDFGRYGNHPAVYVSWFDAVAFCRWLGHRLRVDVRLADEWEWQQAATGGVSGKVYPWGGEWDAKREPQRANTFESRLGRATAVGMYPAGASLQGALDMAGTVWEWCRNQFDTPEVTESRAGDFGARALRGGAWLYDQDNARCAVRNRYRPHSRNDNVGFRVLCSSPIDGH